MHAVGREEAVLNPLFQAVRIERVAEVGVGVAVVVAQGRGRHAQLHRRGEVFQNLVPVALAAGAAPVALVHDDQVEEIGRVFAIQAGLPIRLVHRLVNREVHIAAGVDLALNLVPRIPEQGEVFDGGVVHQDIAIGQEQHFGRAPQATRAVPARAPQLPANLSGDLGFACAGSQREQ